MGVANTSFVLLVLVLVLVEVTEFAIGAMVTTSRLLGWIGVIRLLGVRNGEELA